MTPKEYPDRERCTPQAVGIECNDLTSPELKAKLESYFAIFYAPHEMCVNCGTHITGLLSSFQWGLAHGEGYCVKCGWPARGHHRIKDVTEEPLVTMRNVVLQYHGDGLTLSEPMEDDAA